jgi:hypothetical protein
MMERKRRLAPRPADPPPSFMWWHGELMTIAAVERLAKRIMGKHDDYPRARRDRDNGIVRRFKLSKKSPNDISWEARRHLN